VPAPARQNLRVVLPLVWDLLRPRRGLLAFGFLLMLVNRISGMALPYSTKFLFDNVITQHHIQLLTPIVLSVLAATAVQGITSFSLTQLLSKAAQRLITDLRQQVQAHIGRLPVAFHDSTKTGMLVSRIMSDVEGVRNLIGTGLVDLVGGLLTATIALVLLLRISFVFWIVS
jgi:ABC-type bacteriocin/lantibiotic exporter with double-glycine peptidase domain